MIRRYSPTEFLEIISSQPDLVPVQFPISVEGFVQPHREDASSLSFSPGADCSRWITVPIAIVEYIEHLGTRTCKDHSHPQIRLHLAKPTDPVSNMYAQLLDHHLQKQSARPESNCIQCLQNAQNKLIFCRSQAGDRASFRRYSCDTTFNNAMAQADDAYYSCVNSGGLNCDAQRDSAKFAARNARDQCYREIEQEYNQSLSECNYQLNSDLSACRATIPGCT
jgi:hypothetical protein